MTRTQYITTIEYSELTGLTCTLQDIYEASEIMEYHMFDRLNTYTSATAPDNLKLATAYQIKYMADDIDDDYANSESFTIGKFSNTNKKNGENYKIAPKSQRYLVNGGLTRRYL